MCERDRGEHEQHLELPGHVLWCVSREEGLERSSRGTAEAQVRGELSKGMSQKHDTGGGMWEGPQGPVQGQEQR